MFEDDIGHFRATFLICIYVCICLLFFAQRKKSLDFLEEGSFYARSDKLHFTLQWMGIILKKSWIIKSQLHSIPAWIVKDFFFFFSIFNQPLYIQWSSSVPCFYMRPTNNEFILPDVWVSTSYCPSLWDPPEEKKKKTTLQIRLFKTKPNDKKSLWLFTADKVHVVSEWWPWWTVPSHEH